MRASALWLRSNGCSWRQGLRFRSGAPSSATSSERPLDLGIASAGAQDHGDIRGVNRPEFSRCLRLTFCAAVRTRRVTACHSVLLACPRRTGDQEYCRWPGTACRHTGRADVYSRCEPESRRAAQGAPPGSGNSSRSCPSGRRPSGRRGACDTRRPCCYRAMPCGRARSWLRYRRRLPRGRSIGGRPIVIVATDLADCRLGMAIS